MRKSNRSRRIVKKLMARAYPHPDWQIDAWIADGKRIITAQEAAEAGISWREFADAKLAHWSGLNAVRVAAYSGVQIDRSTFSWWRNA